MRGNEHGFTLLEVLIAVTILAVAMVSAFTVYAHCIVELRRAKNRTIATNCAQHLLEQIMSTPHDVFRYHNLNTSETAPAQNPVAADFATWQAALHAQLPGAIGSIAVIEDPDIPLTTCITVTITYPNYNRPTTTAIALKIPLNFPSR